MNPSFSEGVRVKYKFHIGTIKFICDNYLSVCISPPTVSKEYEVRILIFRNQWKDVFLLKESEK